MYFENRIVAFVDILGFKSKVADAVKSEEAAEKVHKALKMILQLKKDNENIKSETEMKSMGVEVTTFSDSAVISYPANGLDSLFALIIDLIHLQLALASQDILLRGGLTAGPLYHDGDIVYGTAMNEAYRLESKVAVVPRILVDSEIINPTGCYEGHKDGLNIFGETYKEDPSKLEDIQKLLKTDADGNLFIDMLHQDCEMTDDGYEYYEWLSDLRKVIMDGLKNSDINVITKYRWMKDYFNDVVTDNNAFFPVPQNVSEEEMQEFRTMYPKLKI